MKTAISLLMTLPGTPYIYYGEEIGMLGVKPDEHIREPFLWNENGKDPGQTKWIDPKYSTEESVMPLARQTKDEHSLYNYYKQLVWRRNSSRVLSYGDIVNTDLKHSRLISFIRSTDDESYLILHNISSKLVKIKLPDSLLQFRNIQFSSETDATLENGKCTLPPHSTLILN